MCGDSMAKIAEPTQSGVYWRDYTRWVPYSSDLASKIVAEYRSGAPSLDLGSIGSAQYRNGVRYSINFTTMKQKNLDTGFERPIMIVRPLKQEQRAESVRPTKREQATQQEQSVQPALGVGASITIDLQQLAPAAASADHVNLVLKLPQKDKTILPSSSSSVIRKTAELVMEKITKKSFLDTVIRKKLQTESSVEGWNVCRKECFRYGDSAGHEPFLQRLVVLLESRQSLIEELFVVLDHENTDARNIVEFLFKAPSNGTGIYSRKLVASAGEVIGLYMAIGAYIQERGLFQTPADEVSVSEKQSIAHIADLYLDITDSD